MRNKYKHDIRNVRTINEKIKHNDALVTKADKGNTAVSYTHLDVYKRQDLYIVYKQ